MPPALKAILYWLAVVAVSLALVVGLILFFESRDAPELEGGGDGGAPPPATAPAVR